MFQHLGIVQKGFWIGEEFKLFRNQYSNSETAFESGHFSPMMAILDLYLKNNPIKPIAGGSKKSKKGGTSAAQTK